jgi:oxygen-dependent protoporphyrinogen oxidase
VDRRSRREVVVVGAGFAGLAAAFRLAAAGHGVRVLEAGARAGGRAAVAEWQGETLDPTAAAVHDSNASLLGLVRDAGLSGELLPLRPWLAAQAGAGTAASAVSDDGLLAIGRIPGVRALEALRLARLPRLVRRQAAMLDPGAVESAAPLDDRSLLDFGALYFGRRVVTHWIEPWLSSRAPVDERSASRAAFLLRWRAESGGASGALREPPGLLAELLAARSGVRTGCRVRRVDAAPSGRLHVAIEGASEPAEADAVILAVPAPEALRVAEPLLSRAERDLLGAIRYDPAHALVAEARRLPVSAPTRARIPRSTASPLAVVALEPRGRGAGRITAVTRPAWSDAMRDAGDDAVVKELRVEIEARTASELAAGDPVLVRRFPLAWPRFDVGAYRALARFREVQLDRRRRGRRLYLAGDHLASPTLEGAVVSGLRAAADLLSDPR